MTESRHEIKVVVVKYSVASRSGVVIWIYNTR